MSKITTIFSDFVYQNENEELAWELYPACRQLLKQCNADNRYLKGVTTYYSDNEKIRDFREWEYPVFDKFYEFILKSVEEYIDIIGISVFKRPKLTHVWISEMNEGGSHEFHVHNNSWISGNFYVKVPISSSPIVFQKANYGFSNWAGRHCEKKDPINNYEFTIPAQTGSLLLWNSTLTHGVRYNYSKERVSISFNVDLLPVEND